MLLTACLLACFANFPGLPTHMGSGVDWGNISKLTVAGTAPEFPED